MILVSNSMHWLSHSRLAVRWPAAASTVALATLLLVWVHASPITAGMVFLVLVVWSATRATVALSLFIDILCALSFDFFFLPPYHTFALASGQEWIALLSFVITSTVAGRVAESARRQASQAEQRREDVERLYTLSQEMMLHEDAEGLLRNMPRILQRIFALQDVALYIKDQDNFYCLTAKLPQDLADSLREMASGRSSVSTAPDGYDAQGLMLGLSAVGALGWRPAALSREVATAVCAQVAIALTRAIAMEVAARTEAARESERLRTALIDSLTHELRTPLTSIRAAATTLLQAEGLDDTLRLDLATIVCEESARLDALIGEAVEMAEIDADVVRVQASPRHPRALLEHAVDESQAVLARHHVVLDAEESGTTAWFDAHLLGRVFRHLLENAARYSPSGSQIVLRCRRTTDRLVFTVEDNGPGMDSADLPLIFEKFYRGKHGKVLGKGSGMGLAIVRALLIAHGGSIEVSSAPGQGSAFRFWIPLREEARAVEPRIVHRDEPLVP